MCTRFGCHQQKTHGGQCFIKRKAALRALLYLCPQRDRASQEQSRQAGVPAGITMEATWSTGQEELSPLLLLQTQTDLEEKKTPVPGNNHNIMLAGAN